MSEIIKEFDIETAQTFYLKVTKKLLLYKYLPIDKSFDDIKTKGSLSIIRDGTVKFTHPSQFNDPFDCYPEYDVIKYWYALFKSSYMKSFIDEMNEKQAKRKLSPSERILKRKQVTKQKINERIKEFSNGVDIAEAHNNYGVFCLCRNPLNLLMWAHYAKNHTGFVVEFESPIKEEMSIKGNISNEHLNKFFLENFADCAPVTYLDERPFIKNFVDDIDTKHFFIKGKVWEYEQEERLINFLYYINTKDGYYLQKYNRKRILKSVIAGARMTDENFETLRKTIDTVNQELNINVTLHKAELVKEKYALCVSDRPDLDKHNEKEA